MILIGSVVLTQLKSNKNCMRKKTIFLIFTALLFLTLFSFIGSDSIFSQGLEVDYPTIDEYHPVNTDSEGFPDYLKYIIRFFTIVAGVVAFASLSYGGFLWMTSSGDPLKLQKSKTQIISSAVGFFIIISSFILLNSINPTLIVLERIDVESVADVRQPGVYLSLSGSFHPNEPDLMRENVRKITSSARGIGGLEGRIKAIRVVNPTNDDGQIMYRYVVVLHGEEVFRGPCEIITTNSSEQNFTTISPEILQNTVSISIIRAERFGETPYGRAVAYNLPEFRQDANKQPLLPTGGTNFTPLNIEPWSLDVEGGYAVILASGSSWSQMSDECSVFVASKPVTSLVGHHMNRCSPYFFSAFFAAYRSCATHYASFPLYRR